MSPDLQSVQWFKKIRAQNAYVPSDEETALGPASLKERGDRREPRAFLLAHCAPARKPRDANESGQPTAGQFYELTVIAAVVLGLAAWR